MTEKQAEDLLEALKELVSQHCYLQGGPGQEFLYGDLGLSANECALKTLVEIGVMERIPGHLERWRFV